MNRGDYEIFMDWWIANKDEYEALSVAEDGNPYPLANYIEEHGFLATKEARSFVAAHIRGDKKKRGAKRTIEQQAKEIGILGMIRDIQKGMDCGEHTAREVFLDRHPEICSNDDSLRTTIRRAKKSLKEIFGQEITPVLQKSQNSEPE